MNYKSFIGCTIFGVFTSAMGYPIHDFKTGATSGINLLIVAVGCILINILFYDKNAR
jgi:hypothetical protein